MGMATRLLLSVCLLISGLSSQQPSQAPKPVTSTGSLAYGLSEMAQVTLQNEIYRIADGHSLTMDIYRPPILPENARWPVVILVMGYKDTSPVLDQPLKDLGSNVAWGRLIAASGMVAVAYQTTRADDFEAVVAYLRQHAARLDIDPERIGLWSCSANCFSAASFACRKP